MGKTIRIIPHTHWDREWYFTTQRSRVYLMKDVADILDVLEHQDDFTCFVLDAQSSLVDDYLAWAPEDEKRVRRLISSGRLIVGPWYTQTDQMLASGESIVRNLYYGIRRAEELGHSMKVGYVPDAFGQAGNMPQIYRGFGIEDVLFFRGVSDDMTDKTDFTWVGDDGTRVLATQIPMGYMIGCFIPEEEPQFSEFWDKLCLELSASRCATDNVYFPAGVDQIPVRKNLPELVRRRALEDPENTYLISSPEEHFKAVREAAPSLNEVKGEMIVGKHARVHRSIYSSRSDIKALNTKAQNYVANVLEPMATLAHRVTGTRYPHGEIENVWKLLFENAAHDSMGSRVSDAVNADIANRYGRAMDISENLVELESRLIATSVAGADDAWTLTVINPLPQPRNEVVVTEAYLPGGAFAIRDSHGRAVRYTVIREEDQTDYVLAQAIPLNPSRKIEKPASVSKTLIALDLRDIPACGYEQYRIEELAADTVTGRAESRVLEALENEFYRIQVNPNGTLRIYEKSSGKTYEQEAVFVDDGDDGDSFNYSPPRSDYVVRSSDGVAHAQLSGSDLYQEAVVSLEMSVPSDLDARAKGICDARLPITMTIGLRAGSPVIDFSVEIDNCVLSHRLRVLFDAGLSARVNYADEQFGSIRRENTHAKEMALYEKGEQAAEEQKSHIDLTDGSIFKPKKRWQEPPISIEPTQSYAALFDEGHGLALIPQGVREYQIIDDSTIALTIFRTYGHMGKADLLYRPGRPSGEPTIETPDAQLQKTLHFSFGLAVFSTGFNEAGVASLAKAYNTPVQVYDYAPFLNGRLIFALPRQEGSNPSRFSLMNVEGDAIASAIKIAEDSEAIIVRLFNGKYHEAVVSKVHFNDGVSDAATVDLMEREVDKLGFDGDIIYAPELGHCEFCTLKVTSA